MNAETKKLILILLIGTCLIRIVSLLLAIITYSKNSEIKNEQYNIIWAVIMCLLVVFEIMSYIIENRALPTLILIKLIMSPSEVLLVVMSFKTECQSKFLCRVNDIYIVFITSYDLLSLIYIIYLYCKLPRRRALGANLLDVLGENDNPKNPVPPVVDKIVGENENINRGTDEIDIDEI
ncbi:unnamed protein product [Rhizophagus irregularis]|nr:unnamed protein product [Rhizophagus irregularis]